MANYTGNPNIFTPGISFLDNDLNWDLPNPFTMAPINPSLLQNSNLDLQSLMGFSSINNDKILNENQMSQLHAKLLGNLVEPTPTTTVKIPSLSASSHQVKASIVQQPSIDPQIEASIVSSRYGNESSISTTTNKRKVEDFAESSCSLYSSPSNSNRPPKKNSSSRGKKSNKSIEKVEGNSKDVVHVRARRGQATDSHSIAERVRRGKINERLRCLQDIVPGCYKTMGMAVMLDEIINYVQSLQNQVEFLSMKLTAASQYHDFNAESEPEEKKQKIKACNSEEAHDMERIINKGGYDQVALDNFFQSGWPF